MRSIFPSVKGLTERLFKECLSKANIRIDKAPSGFGGCALAEQEEYSEMDNIELKPCPHCGSTDLELVGGKGLSILGVPIPEAEIYFVRCKCTARGAQDVSKNGAINQWNMRAERQVCHLILKDVLAECNKKLIIEEKKNKLIKAYEDAVTGDLKIHNLIEE